MFLFINQSPGEILKFSPDDRKREHKYVFHEIHPMRVEIHSSIHSHADEEEQQALIPCEKKATLGEKAHTIYELSSLLGICAYVPFWHANTHTYIHMHKQKTGVTEWCVQSPLSPIPTICSWACDKQL